MTLTKTEALIITSQPNLYYFSKINAESGVFLLLTKNKKFVLTDTRFIKTAAKVAKEHVPVATDKHDLSWWQNLLKKNQIKTIYFDPYDLTYHRLTKFRQMSRRLARLQPTKVNLQELRSQKTEPEITLIAKAAHLTEKILAETIKICRPAAHSARPISEQDVVLEIHKQALARNCSKFSFTPIVAFGRNTGIPHHQPSKFRKLKRGDIILIDLGVKYQNYCADLTRTFFTASPTSRQAEIYQKVLTVQEQSIKKIKAGAQTSQLYEEAGAGFGRLAPHFTHGLGHGVGLEIHEHPSLKQKSPDVLRAGQVLTVEPGLYFSWGGIRIEDLVLVKKDGRKILTKFPKELSKIIF